MSIPAEFALAASVVAAVVILSRVARLGLEGLLLQASVRAAVQLSVIALILRCVFRSERIEFVFGLLIVMTGLAAQAALSRVRVRHRRLPSIAVLALVASTWSMTALAVLTVFQVHPWYSPRTLIPFAGILLGNCVSGIAVGMDQWLTRLFQQREPIELLLSHGATRSEAVREILREALRTALMPTLNAMTVAGLVSLPGMMVGQILAGADPLEASRTQVTLLVLMTAGTLLGTLLSIALSFRIVFNIRHQFLIEELQHAPKRKEASVWNPSRLWKRATSASAS